MADLNHAPKGLPVPPGKLELTGITSKTVPIKKGGLYAFVSLAGNIY